MHLAQTIAILKCSKDWEDFENQFIMVFPPKEEVIELTKDEFITVKPKRIKLSP